MIEGWHRLRERVAVGDGLPSTLFGAPPASVAAFFRGRPDTFQDYQSTLRRANIQSSYDEHLAMAVRDGVLSAVVGGVTAGFVVGAVGLSGLIAPPVSGATVVFTAVIGGFLAGLVVGGWQALRPSVVVRRRRQWIDAVLPYGTVLMYALARGGVGLDRLTDAIADSQATYGELAIEFARMRNDVTRFGRNQLEALSAARERAPSERFETFLDDLSTVVESGASLRDFLSLQVKSQLTRMRRDQEALIQTLEIFTQSYFVAVFIAPLFGIVLLVLLSFVGADTVPLIELIIYVDLPIATIGAVWLAKRMEVSGMGVGSLPVGAFGRTDPVGPPPDDEAVTAYVRRQQRRSWRRRLTRPVVELRRNPWWSLLGSIPIAIVVGGILADVLGVGQSLTGGASRPVAMTAVVAISLMTVVLPVTVFHEWRRVRDRRLVDEFPAVLDVVQDANEVGMDLIESFAVVGRRLDGPMATELRTVYEDVKLTRDVETGLGDLSARIRVPEIRLSIRVLHLGYRSTGNLAEVIGALSTAFENQRDLQHERRQAMQLFVVILVLGVLTFVVISFFLDAFFFPPLAEASRQLAGTGVDQAFLRPSTIPIERYHTLLFHATLIQAVGNSLLMGTLVDNRPISGLKYAIPLVAITVVVFLLL